MRVGSAQREAAQLLSERLEIGGVGEMNGRARLCIEEGGASARPIIFENADVYAYSHGGSGFLARYGGHVLFITAKHCLTRFQRPVADLRIACDLSAPQVVFFGISHPTETASSDADDVDCTDFLISRYNVSAGVPCSAMDLSSDSFLDPVEIGSPSMYIRGYPFALKDTEFNETDLSRLKFQAFMCQGEFAGHDNTAEHLSVLKVLTSQQLSDANGLSGSPVFCVVNAGCPRIVLCGLVLRGGTGIRMENGQPVTTVRVLNGRWLGAGIRQYATDLQRL